MKKRVLSLLIAMVMVIGLLPMVSMAAGTPVTISVEAKESEVLVGETIHFDVYIQVEAGTPVHGIQANPVIPANMTMTESAIADGLKAALAADEATWENGAPIMVAAPENGLKNLNGKVKIASFACTAAKANTYEVAPIGGGNDDAIIDDIYAPYEAGTDLTVVTASVTVKKDPSKQTLGSLTLAYDKTAAAFGTANMADVVLTPTVTAMDDDEPAGAMATMPALTFTTDPVSIDGVNVAADGKITIDKTAPAGTFTVKVSSGAVESAAVTVTVSKDAAVPTTVELTGPATAIIPAAATDPAKETEAYTAVVKDQYGAIMSDKTATVEIDGTNNTGATLTGNKLSVPATATAGTLTLKATCETATPATLTVSVTKIAFTGADAAVKASDGVYGAKLGDLVKIDASKLTAKVGETTVTGTYSIKEGKDTVPAVSDTVAWTVVFNSDDAEKTYKDIEVAAGTVKVEAKKVNVTADDIRVYVNSDASEVEYSYTADKLVGEDKYDDSGVTYTLYATNEDGTKGAAATLKTDAVASYFIEVGGITASANYEITFVDGTLNVRKKNSNPPPFGQGTAPSGTDTGTTVTPVANPEFNDVKEGDWFYDSVMAVAKKGLMTGTADKVFSPSLNTTRAQIATILWREAGSPAPRARIADFPDVADGAWYADAVRWCTEQEIVNGFDDGTFRPNDNITREQMVAMMYRYAEKTGMDVSATADLADFADADAVGTWAVPYVEWAVGAKLIQGKGEGNLDPQGLATRAEVATILQRFVEMGK